MKMVLVFSFGNSEYRTKALESKLNAKNASLNIRLAPYCNKIPISFEQEPFLERVQLGDCIVMGRQGDSPETRKSKFCPNVTFVQMLYDCNGLEMHIKNLCRTTIFVRAIGCQKELFKIPENSQ